MVKFLLWLILFVLCWPLAVLGLILYPIVWLLLLPFRLIGLAFQRVLKSCSNFKVLFNTQNLPVAEHAQHSLVGGQRFDRFGLDEGDQGSRQDSGALGHGRDDAVR